MSELANLHVISKISEILKSWFNVELFFTDLPPSVPVNWSKDYNFENQMLAVLNKTDHGMSALGHDFEKFFDSKKPSNIYESSFSGVLIQGESVEIDVEVAGGVFVYPIVT